MSTSAPNTHSDTVPGVRLRTTLASGPRVDRDSGIIYRVPIITAGATLPSGGGHGSFDVDAKSLQQVAASINASDKTRSRITHPEVEGADGIDRRVGYFRNATIEANKVYADFYFGSYASDDQKTLLCGLVEEEPEDIGVSIVSDDAQVIAQSGTQTGYVLRLNKVDSVDWTDDPAANPAGMLSAQRKGIQRMEFNEQQLAQLVEFGLQPDADPAAYYQALTPEQKAEVDALASVAIAEHDDKPESMSADKGEEPNVATMEDEDKPQSMSAKKSNGVSLTAEQVAEQIAEAQKAERARVREIGVIASRCGFDRKWVDKHVDNATNIEEVRRVALNSLERKPSDMQHEKVTVGSDLNRESLRDAVQDALFLKAGQSRIVEMSDNGRLSLSADGSVQTRNPHERAGQFRGHSMIEIGRRYLIALATDPRDREKVMSMPAVQLAGLLVNSRKQREAFSGIALAQATGDFANLLADSMGKFLRNEYALAPATWPTWCRRTTAPDFKDIKKIQLSEAANLAVIPEGDEYEYSTLTDSKESYALETQGKGIRFTRQALINDDLDAFSRVPALMGRAARRAEETAAISILTTNAALSDGNNLFSTAHANLTTGALTVTSLGAAKAAMMKQTALGSDDPLELTPSVLLVPSDIETTARQLVASTVDPAKSNSTPNPFANQLQVAVSARLSNTSDKQWYLMASNNEIDTVEVAFLDGEEAPVVEEETDFNTDAINMKVRHTFKYKAIDYRGLVRSSGA